MSATSIPYFVISIIPTVPGEVVFLAYHFIQITFKNHALLTEIPCSMFILTDGHF